MRISGGRARGIPLKVPRGVDVRPAMDKLRQGLFSSLGERVVGARFLDVFAGTGSYGLEALSRGAAAGWFIERDRAATAALRENLAAVARSAGFQPGAATIVPADVMTWIPPAGTTFDLIFADPPFGDIAALGESLFRRLAGFAGGEAHALLAFEMPGELELPAPGWRFLKRIGRGRDQPTCCLYRRDT
jgi:16S rRNA (guanine966-N2)-methyltransferase